MTAVFTVDECYGLAFGKKRQSRDRALTRDLVSYANGRRIVADEYSRILFDEAGIDAAAVCFTDEPLREAKSDELVLFELACPKEVFGTADEIVVYHWNRRYPSTAKLDIGEIEKNFRMSENFDFVGNSHEKLTRVTYKRK